MLAKEKAVVTDWHIVVAETESIASIPYRLHSPPFTRLSRHTGNEPKLCMHSVCSSVSVNVLSVQVSSWWVFHVIIPNIFGLLWLENTNAITLAFLNHCRGLLVRNAFTYAFLAFSVQGPILQFIALGKGCESYTVLGLGLLAGGS